MDPGKMSLQTFTFVHFIYVYHFSFFRAAKSRAPCLVSIRAFVHHKSKFNRYDITMAHYQLDPQELSQEFDNNDSMKGK